MNEPRLYNLPGRHAPIDLNRVVSVMDNGDGWCVAQYVGPDGPESIAIHMPYKAFNAIWGNSMRRTDV